MGEHKTTHAGVARYLRRLSRRRVSRLDRTLRFLVAKRRLVNQQISAARRFDRRRARSRVARDHDCPAGSLWPNENRRLDHSTVVERHRFAAVDLSPERTLGDSDLAREIGIESSLPIFLDQRVA